MPNAPRAVDRGHDVSPKHKLIFFCIGLLAFATFVFGILALVGFK